MLEPVHNTDPEGWVARWRDVGGEERAAGLHPSREDALDVAAAMALACGRDRAAKGSGRPRKRYARALKPVPVKKGPRAMRYQGRWKTGDGQDLRVPGLCDNPDEALNAAVAAANAWNDTSPAAGIAHPIEYYVEHWPALQAEETLNTHNERLGTLLRVHPKLAPVPVDELARNQVYDVKDALVEYGYPADYIRQLLHTLSALIEILRDHDIIVGKNVAARIRITSADRKFALANREQRIARERAEAVEKGEKPRRDAPTPRAIPAEEFHATLAFAPTYLRALLKIAVVGGFRPGEFFASNRHNVDRGRQLIAINETISRRGKLMEGTKNTYTKPLGERSRYTLFLPELLDELDAARVPDIHGYWVRAPTGGFTNPNNFRNRVFKPVMQAAETAQVARCWTLKDLRHTFSTELLKAGIPITHVAHWMGDQVTIEDEGGKKHRVRSQAVLVYEHPDDTHVARAADVMRVYLRLGQQRLFGSD